MRLRKQAERCELGDKLEDHVKDQLIGKYASSVLRRKLLALGDATLDVVLGQAKAYEAVQEQSKALGDKKSDHNKEFESTKLILDPNRTSFQTVRMLNVIAVVSRAIAILMKNVRKRARRSTSAVDSTISAVNVVPLNESGHAKLLKNLHKKFVILK